MLQSERWMLTYRLASWGQDIGVYAVLLDKQRNNEVVRITKRPVTPRDNGGGPDALRLELAVYADSINHPILDGNQFSGWDYWFINGWEDEIITDDEMTKCCEREYRLSTESDA